MSLQRTTRRELMVGRLVIRHNGLVVILLVVGLACFGRGHRQAQAHAGETAKAHAVLHGRTIGFKPAGPSFEIPNGWIEWHAEFKNNIHLSPAELASVRIADNEWDKEYAEIVNAVLRFESCVAHLGSDGWGRNAGSYHDVQMRAYLVDLSPEEIRQRMAKEGPSTAFRFSKRESLSRSEFGKWQRVTLSYDLWYSDYGGTANVDVFARAFGKQTAVLVFMYADSLRDPRRQVAEIVHSFTWKQ